MRKEDITDKYMEEYMLAEEKDSENAIAEYIRSYENGNLYALNCLANLYNRLNDYTNSEKYYIISLENNVPYAELSLSGFYIKHKEYVKAEDLYTKLATPDNPYLVELARIYILKGEYKTAIKYYKNAIQNGTGGNNGCGDNCKDCGCNNNNLIGELGDVYSLTGNTEEAIIHYKTALKTNEKYAYKLGCLYFTLKKYTDAAKMFKKEYKDSRYCLGKTYVELGKFTEAKTIFEREIKKGNIEANYNLGHIWMTEKNYTKAEQYFLQDTSEASQYFLARIYNLMDCSIDVANDNTAKAMKYYEITLRNFIDKPKKMIELFGKKNYKNIYRESLTHLSYIYVEERLKEKAIELCKQISLNYELIKITKEDFKKIINIYSETDYYQDIYDIFSEQKFTDILDFPEIIYIKCKR
jgi:tetratricopeptide (TPR) repeat protein